jgi:hypothetical protein
VTEQPGRGARRVLRSRRQRVGRQGRHAGAQPRQRGRSARRRQRGEHAVRERQQADAVAAGERRLGEPCGEVHTLTEHIERPVVDRRIAAGVDAQQHIEVLVVPKFARGEHTRARRDLPVDAGQRIAGLPAPPTVDLALRVRLRRTARPGGRRDGARRAAPQQIGQHARDDPGVDVAVPPGETERAQQAGRQGGPGVATETIGVQFQPQRGRGVRLAGRDPQFHLRRIGQPHSRRRQRQQLQASAARRTMLQGERRFGRAAEMQRGRQDEPCPQRRPRLQPGLEAEAEHQQQQRHPPKADDVGVGRPLLRDERHGRGEREQQCSSGQVHLSGAPASTRAVRRPARCRRRLPAPPPA